MARARDFDAPTAGQRELGGLYKDTRTLCETHGQEVLFECFECFECERNPGRERDRLEVCLSGRKKCVPQALNTHAASPTAQTANEQLRQQRGSDRSCRWDRDLHGSPHISAHPHPLATMQCHHRSPDSATPSWSNTTCIYTRLGATARVFREQWHSLSQSPRTSFLLGVSPSLDSSPAGFRSWQLLWERALPQDFGGPDENHGWWTSGLVRSTS